jgi:hypothetical protein
MRSRTSASAELPVTIAEGNPMRLSLNGKTYTGRCPEQRAGNPGSLRSDFVGGLSGTGESCKVGNPGTLPMNKMRLQVRTGAKARRWRRFFGTTKVVP